MNKNMWKTIESLGWKKNGYDYKKIAGVLFSTLDQHQRKELRTFDNQAIASLMDRIRAFEQSERPLNIGSNDGLSDVLHHIIGLGQSEFARCMNFPVFIEERYKAEYGSDEGYTDSFAYCFLEPDPELPHTIVPTQQTQHIVYKITPGFVIQSFDLNSKKFISQAFTAGANVDYEDQFGDAVPPEKLAEYNFGPNATSEPYLPFDMVQPKES